MRTTGLAVLLLVAGTACSADVGASVPSSSVAPADIPPCDEVYTEGKEVTRDDFGDACTTTAEELIAPRPVRIECEDDRQLLWNDLAWGYLNEGMTLIPEDQVTKLPEEALADCLAGPGSQGLGPTTTAGS
jgi:hypothetical protein